MDIPAIARSNRIILPGQTHRMVQRSCNRLAVFFNDRRIFLKWLDEALGPKDMAFTIPSKQVPNKNTGFLIPSRPRPDLCGVGGRQLLSLL
jgi:hypothetical protein